MPIPKGKLVFLALLLSAVLITPALALSESASAPITATLPQSLSVSVSAPSLSSWNIIRNCNNLQCNALPNSVTIHTVSDAGASLFVQGLPLKKADGTVLSQGQIWLGSPDYQTGAPGYLNGLTQTVGPINAGTTDTVLSVGLLTGPDAQAGQYTSNLVFTVSI